MRLSNSYQLLFLAAVVLAIYSPIIPADFSPIDDQNMVDTYLSIGSIDFYRFFFPESGYYWRPLTSLTYLLDRCLWGMEPSFMHLTNVLFHLANAMLLFAVALRVKLYANIEAHYFPLATALLFALHPINTESVSWVSARTDLVACFFLLIALWYLLQAFIKKQMVWMAPAICAYIFACLAKETAIFFYGAAACLVYGYYRQQGQRFIAAIRNGLWAYCLWFLGAIVYLVMRAFALSGGDSGIRTAAEMMQGDRGLLDNLRVAFKVLGFYSKKLFAPFPLNFGIINVSDGYLSLGILLLVAIVFMVWRANLVSCLFLSSFCLTLATLLVALGRLAWAPIAERYLYMPATTFCLACGLAFVNWRCFQQERLRSLVVGLLLAVCAVTTYQRVQTWSDPLVFFQDLIEKSPKFVPAQNELIRLYIEHGNKEEAERLIARSDLLVGDLGYANIDINRAALELEEGRLENARSILLERLNNPGKQFLDIASALIKVNFLLLADDRSSELQRDLRDENVQLLRQMVDLSTDPFLQYRLGKAYLAVGDKEKALFCFENASKRAPVDAFYRSPAKKLVQKLAQ